MFMARVYITLKPTVNDPQGLTIKGGLEVLGFSAVRKVRAGKYLEIWLEGGAKRRPGKRLRRCAASFWPIPS